MAAIFIRLNFEDVSEGEKNGKTCYIIYLVDL